MMVADAADIHTALFHPALEARNQPGTRATPQARSTPVSSRSRATNLS